MECYNERISTIVRQLRVGKKTLSFGIALFLIVGAVSADTFVLKVRSASATGILGGPSAVIDPISTPEEATLTGVSKAATDPGENLSTNPESSLSAASFTAIDAMNPSMMEQGALIAQAEGVPDEADASLPRLPHYFIQPTSGYNWGILHAHNAVDIANACGTQVVAAADGVVIAEDEGNWNSGYGSYITIEHPNSTRTKYAHLSRVLVSAGDEVHQGDKIGEIGNTGYVHGGNGCHLHFEVAGAANPFAKK